MKIIDRLPIPDRSHVVAVSGDVVQVHRNQIIVWVSINDRGRPLPAILDTGHGHNLSLSEKQLSRWSGATLERIGELEMDRKRVVQYAADVHLHRNLPGKREFKGDSYPLEMPQGITILPDEHAPRLPLIGLRTIIANKLRLVIDGRRETADGDAEDGVVLDNERLAGLGVSPVLFNPCVLERTKQPGTD